MNGLIERPGLLAKLKTVTYRDYRVDFQPDIRSVVLVTSREFIRFEVRHSVSLAKLWMNTVPWQDPIPIPRLPHVRWEFQGEGCLHARFTFASHFRLACESLRKYTWVLPW